MPENHLICKTSPKANPKNILFWQDYRITVLSDRLFRIEKNGKKKFRDDATLSVWFRNMPPQKFSVEKSENSLVVRTEKCVLTVGKDREDCRVDFGDGQKPINNGGNLKGTFRTLDGYDGDKFLYKKSHPKIRLENGVCSRTGVAVYDDAKSLTLGKDGKIYPQKGEGTDEYVFAFGDDYRGAVNALYLITGNVPLLPRFALGNWWSRYHYYTDEEYLRLLNGFSDDEIPLSIATVDMDWHYSEHIFEEINPSEAELNDADITGEHSSEAWSVGWTGYTWNPNLFPDYRGFLKAVNDKNLVVTLNLHPAQGVRFWEKQYAEMAEKTGVDPATKKAVKFDFTSDDFVNAYFSVLHKPYEREGVGFWWIDWQQGTKSDLAGLDPLWALNHYHYLDNAVNHGSGLILSRYSGVGAHRYPVGFTGDTYITWRTLKYLTYFTPTATNIGYTWWSHDIGGHHFGIHDDDLYVRFLQYGVFSPVNRLHCTHFETLSKEPRYYGNGSGEIAKNQLRFRRKLVPFLYTANYQTHAFGKALTEPLYYEWKNEEAYDYKNEFLFGGLLVAPVVTPLKKDGFARTEGWIPEGKWTDIFTGDEYVAGKDGKKVVFLRRLESVPCLAKAGTILPLDRDGKSNGTANPVSLDVYVFEGNGKYDMYEKYGKKSAFTHFENAYSEKDGKAVQTLKITADTNCPTQREMRILFKNVPFGKTTGGEEYLTDCACSVVKIKRGESAEVSVSYEIRSDKRKFEERVQKVLLCANGDNGEKWNVYRAVLNAKSVEEGLKAVEESKIPSVEKQRIKENL